MFTLGTPVKVGKFEKRWLHVLRLEGISIIGSRWVYKVKHVANGNVEKYKAKFVAKGFSQVEGIDYEEIFSLVGRYPSMRTILALAAQLGWRIHQMDLKISFLNGLVEEEIYIERTKGFKAFSKETHLCRLKRALYGIKQAPRARYTCIDSYLSGLGFTMSEADANLY